MAASAILKYIYTKMYDDWNTVFGVCVGDWACACNFYQALAWPSLPPNFESLGIRLLRHICMYMYSGFQLR